MEQPNNPTTIHQLIIFKPIQELDSVFTYVESHTTKYFARQHPQDGKTKRVHTHIMLYEPSVSKNSFVKELNKLGITGSKMFSYLTVVYDTKAPYDEIILGGYITKGKIDNIKQKGYTDWDIGLFVESYKARKNSIKEFAVIEPKDSKPLNVESQFEILLCQAKDFFKGRVPELIHVRSWTLKAMTSKSGLLPQPGSYKRIACSIYLIIKRNAIDNETIAIEEILDWNY